MTREQKYQLIKQLEPAFIVARNMKANYVSGVISALQAAILVDEAKELCDIVLPYSEKELEKL